MMEECVFSPPPPPTVQYTPTAAPKRSSPSPHPPPLISSFIQRKVKLIFHLDEVKNEFLSF